MTDPTPLPTFTHDPLFLVTPLPLVRVGLRRYQSLAGGWRCGPNKRHEATTWLPEPREQAVGDHRRIFLPEEAGQPLPEPLWPTSCEQGKRCTNETEGDPKTWAYLFTSEDHAVVLHERLGRREDTGEHVLAYTPPVGGVVDLDYLARPAEDGRCLAVMTPDGLWYLDVAGRAGERFERHGMGHALTVVQTAGLPWRWRIDVGLLYEEPSRAR